jgi:hypothetical protein
MPIGKFKDFKALKGALLSRADKRLRKTRPPDDSSKEATPQPRATSTDPMKLAAAARVANRKSR